MQHLGLLLWGACGKDPGFGPQAILSHARRSARYTQEGLSELAFEGEPPDAGVLSRTCHTAALEAEAMLDVLPAQSAGGCVLERRPRLYRNTLDGLRRDVDTQAVHHHAGPFQGAYPEIRPDQVAAP